MFANLKSTLLRNITCSLACAATAAGFTANGGAQSKTQGLSAENPQAAEMIRESGSPVAPATEAGRKPVKMLASRIHVGVQKVRLRKDGAGNPADENGDKDKSQTSGEEDGAEDLNPQTVSGTKVVRKKDALELAKAKREEPEAVSKLKLMNVSTAAHTGRQQPR